MCLLPQQQERFCVNNIVSFGTKVAFSRHLWCIVEAMITPIKLKTRRVSPKNNPDPPLSLKSSEGMYISIVMCNGLAVSELLRRERAHKIVRSSFTHICEVRHSWMAVEPWDCIRDYAWITPITIAIAAVYTLASRVFLLCCNWQDRIVEVKMRPKRSCTSG